MGVILSFILYNLLISFVDNLNIFLPLIIDTNLLFIYYCSEAYYFIKCLYLYIELIFFGFYNFYNDYINVPYKCYK